jgi:hypothetical protein
MGDDVTNEEQAVVYRLEEVKYTNPEQVIEAFQANRKELRANLANKGDEERRRWLIQQAVILVDLGKKKHLTIEQLEGVSGGTGSVYSDKTSIEAWVAKLSMEDDQTGSVNRGSRTGTSETSVEYFDGSGIVW